MVKVYRPDGVTEEKASVDARECVEHCGYGYEPVVIEAAAESTDDAKTAKSKAKAAALDEQNEGPAA